MQTLCGLFDIRVIYLWLCECGCYYIDKTSREFCIRVRKHLYAIDICNLLSSLGCHRAMDHGYKQIWVCFTALDRVHPDLRGGDFDRAVLQRETHWIFHLRAVYYPGLNDAVNYKAFI